MAQIVIGEPLGAGSGNIHSAAPLEEVREIAESLAKKYLVKVRDGACGVCGDGRGCTHTLGETAPEPGPSVFGGPEITGYGAAELVGDYFGPLSSPDIHTVNGKPGRMDEIGDILAAGGISLGAHVSAGAVSKTDGKFINPETGKPETGCGANDKFVGIMNQTVGQKQFVDTVTGVLLGEAFDSNYTKYVDQAGLQARLKGYDPRESLGEVAKRAEGRNVEVLEGEHAELVVVFNYQRGYTIDRDAFVKETGKQVFVVDMWYIDDLADAMAAGRPDAVEMRERLRHAMVAFQVGTYLELCDGSHRPVIIMPQEQAAEKPALAAH